MAKILVVDDEPGIVKLLEALLCDAGHDVIGAASCESALAELDQRQIDLILLDLMMPKMSGWDFLDKLTELQESHPPVAIVSAVFQEKAIERAKQKYKASAYITKPFRVDDLLDTINSALEHVPSAN